MYISPVFFFYIEIMTAGIPKTVQDGVIVPSCLQRKLFLYQNKIRWMIASHCLQTARGNLRYIFSGNRCFKIWLLCTCGRNHPKNISKVALQAFSLQVC